jgi:hypothetical protein
MDNWVTSRDPGFADVPGRNFATKDDVLYFAQSGFRPIPFAEIGLYESPQRATWPVKP